MKKAPITTHILNLESGKPAAGVVVSLFEQNATNPLATAVTDSDGRVIEWDIALQLNPGIYCLHFAVGDWFAHQGKTSFYPEIKIAFYVERLDEHYHVPLLLNSHGYSTYRGS
jgi:5-hydroxyisourate hydrolase